MFIKQFSPLLFRACISLPIFLGIQTQVLAAQGYRLPFPAGKSVPVNQSCVDSIDGPTCKHSKISQIKYAIDFGCSIGDPIVAIQDGVVDRLEFKNDYGNLIKIKHNDGKYSLYAHLKEPSPLSLGASVSSGQAIGKCGMTGDATGPHLHLELRPTSSYSTVPIYFDECNNNSLCRDGQVYYPESYLSINTGSSTNNAPCIINSPSPGGAGRMCIPIREGQVMWKEFLTLSSDSPLSLGAKIVAVSNGSEASGLNRRETPGGTLIGNQDIAWGTVGTYTGGFGVAPIGGINYNWLNIDWGNGKSGYSAENFLNYVYTLYKVVPSNNSFDGNGESFTEPILPETSNPSTASVSEPSSVLGLLSVAVTGVLVKLRKKSG
ncbi:M23 family metallopeptidase [Limnofasciculus baicalensis]|uniref:M23 family metallopeptidase n=1 Tax=Limnofasciculus baicalensis BBK-W-15 TaxID=2699891 RepID=A0AAE3GSA7_9CYAN|nr:M23 family metallopeptidase [Limnofasciculus baicalensis]MCP2727642.1 M23 family metallopeptidase [Limnofasciculus baicalensis BBK-W-15]